MTEQTVSFLSFCFYCMLRTDVRTSNVPGMVGWRPKLCPQNPTDVNFFLSVRMQIDVCVACSHGLVQIQPLPSYLSVL